MNRRRDEDAFFATLFLFVFLGILAYVWYSYGFFVFCLFVAADACGTWSLRFFNRL